MPVQLTKIGKYDVLEVIGRGGMGVVYKATDPHIGRFVAIKMITAGFAGNPDLLKRFYREAQSTGNLQSPNIVTVYDLGDQDGNPYLVMEYLEGASLESIIAARKPLTMVEKLGIIIDACNGLSYAHQRGVIHRDIKPANIMVLNDGVAKIVDFGIARIGNNRDTGTGQVIGSLHYMSAEQLRGQPLDFRSDIYSTGVVLFQLLTNELPFDASETGATLLKIIQEPAPPLSAYLKDYPRELDHVLARALAKNRDERYGSAKDLAFDLLRIQEQIKQSSVAEFLRRASSAIQRAEWSKAKDQLQQALRVDRQHTEAHRLLRDVQVKLDKQQKSEQARRLQMSADQAFIERKFDEALSLLDQALALDSTNLDVLTFRESVQAAKERAAKLEDALRRAEAAQIAGNLEEASQAVAEALALDSNDTQAKALKVILGRQIEERAQQEEMRRLLDQARADLSARRIASALDLLHRAESLEPASIELKTLMKMAVAASEQERRRADLEKLGQEIQEALSREDYGAAADKAAAGLQRYPRERELLKLQALAEAQRQRVEQRRFAREQLVAASSLLDQGRMAEALAILESASHRVPDYPEIASLRALIKERLSKAEAEEHRARVLQQARDAMAERDYGKAVQILENLRTDFPHSSDIHELLTRARAEHVQQRAVAEAQVFATQLIEQGQLERAAEFLESTQRDMPDQSLSNLLGEARSQLAEFRAGVQSSIDRGQRILREHGAAEATKFLDAQPAEYSAVSGFRELRQGIRSAQMLEDLDRELADTSNLDQCVALAEKASQSNPGNAQIQQRLLEVRQKRDLVQAIVSRARELERAQEYAHAIESWHGLKKIYPHYPNLNSELVRLEKLEQQREALLEKRAREAEVQAQRAREAESERAREAEAQAAKAREEEARKAREAEERARKAEEAEARRLREAELKASKAREAEARKAQEAELCAQKKREEEDRRTREAEAKAGKAREAEARKAREADVRAHRARAAEAEKARVGDSAAALRSETAQIESTRPESKRSILARPIRVAAAVLCAVIIIAVTFTLLHRTSQIAVHIETDPSGSRIAINGGVCTSPCILQLKPGTYTIRADHEGYETLSRNIAIDRSDSVPLLRLQPTIIAPASQPPSEEPGTLAIHTNVDADVFVDGEFKGNTGSAHRLKLSIPEGPHEIRVQKPDWQANSQNVVVAQKSTATVSFRLEHSPVPQPSAAEHLPPPQLPSSATLIIEAPPGAQVIVDQKAVGVVPQAGELAVPVSAGEHNLEARLDGYKPWSRSAMFKAGTPLAVLAELTKIEAAPKPTPPAAPISATLTANPATVQPGQSAMLVWQTKNATDVTIDGGVGTVPASGSKQVNPAQTSTYTLTAKGPSGTSTSSFSIVVAKEPTTPGPLKTEQLSAADQSEIQAVLDSYAEAFANKDLRAVQALWPGVPKEKLNSIKEAFKLNTHLRYVSPKFYREPGERARVDCTQFSDAMVEGKTVQNSGRFTLYVVRRDGHWKIDYIPLNN